MKKNTMMRIASCLLIAVLMTTCVISGTFAKYTSDATATSSARVALWKFTTSTDGTDNIAQTEAFTFDLFDTVLDSDVTNEEEDVKEGTSEVIIAPGTSGMASVVLTNASEVNATYEVAFTATGDGAVTDDKIPLQWSTNGTSWVNDISALDISTTAINMGDDATITVYWKWAFESDTVVDTDQTNAGDTALGIDAAAAVTFTAVVTMTQVD